MHAKIYIVNTYCVSGSGNIALNKMVKEPSPPGSHILEEEKDNK